ncbi:TPA: terminase [Streptococcus suis]
MSRELTKQEQDFVAFLVAGQTQREAYRNAFKQSVRWKDKTVDNRASELFNIREVQGRYNELLRDAKKKSSKMAIWSREQAFSEYEWLKDKSKADIEREGIRQANSNAFLSAIEGMNNMAFKDLELSDEKLKLEIEKLKQQIETNETQEDRVTAFYFDRGEMDAD